MTGSKADRPAFKELVKASRERRHDIVLVWKLDRFSRSLRDLLNTLQELQELDIAFVSLKDNLDLTTSAGRLMTHIIGAFAEFERDIIRERVKAGLVNAKAKGKKLGRRGLAPIEIKRAIDAYEQDSKKSVRKVAKAARISPASAGRILKDYKAGLLDRDGHKYEKPLFSVSKTPLKSKKATPVKSGLRNLKKSRSKKKC